MKGKWGSAGLGLLLVAAGILFLLQNLGFLGDIDNLIWMMLFGLGGLAFLAVFAANRENWWAIIPGFTLLGLALLIGFGDRLGVWGGAFFLGAIGLSFWVIYALKREFWWAVIPGGALMTLALVAGLGSVAGDLTAGVFFLGLAATFGLVYLLPNPEGRMTWALIPAGVLAVMGLLLLATLGGLVDILGPVVLILVGAFLVLWTTVLRRK